MAKKGGTGGTGARNRVLKLAAEDRRQRVCARYMQRLVTGDSVAQIAKDFGVTRRTIEKDIERSFQLLDEDNRKAINDIVPQGLQVANMVMAEAWQGWKRSCLESVSRTDTEGTGGEGGSYSMKSVTRRNSPGDPRFLSVMNQTLAYLDNVHKRMTASEESTPDKQPALVEIVVKSAEERDQVLSFNQFKAQAKAS